jgi:hypothetical protein
LLVWREGRPLSVHTSQKRVHTKVVRHLLSHISAPLQRQFTRAGYACGGENKTGEQNSPLVGRHLSDWSRRMIIEAEQPASRAVSTPRKGVRQVPLMGEGNVGVGRTPSTPLAWPRLGDGHTDAASRLPSGTAHRHAHDAGQVQGVLLQQRYHLLRQVGKGGFGVIYQAVDTHFGNRLVAIKQLNQKSIAAQKYTAASEAFKREALVARSPCASESSPCLRLFL